MSTRWVETLFSATTVYVRYGPRLVLCMHSVVSKTSVPLSYTNNIHLLRLIIIILPHIKSIYLIRLVFSVHLLFYYHHHHHQFKIEFCCRAIMNQMIFPPKWNVTKHDDFSTNGNNLYVTINLYAKERKSYSFKFQINAKLLI